MKKVLYSTTALAAAGMFAFSGADAQAAEKIKLSISGSYIALIGVSGGEDTFGYRTVTSEDDGVNPPDEYVSGFAANKADNYGSVNMIADSEVSFKGNTTLDNGVRVDVIIDLETDQVNANRFSQHATDATKGKGGVVIDESYIKVGNLKGWGEFRFGSTKQAHFTFKVNAPAVNTINNALNNDTSDRFLPNPTGTKFFNHDGGADHMKAVYITPNLNGFQAGISYTPGQANSDGPPATEGDMPGDTNDISIGANYKGKFGDAGVALSGGYTRHTGAKEYTTIQAGGSVSFSGFSIGGGWAERSDDKDGMTAADIEGFMAGVGYKTGPWSLALTWLNTTDDETDAEGKDELNQYTLGMAYSLGAGVTVGASLFQAKFEDEEHMASSFPHSTTDQPLETRSTAQNNEGWGALAGIKVAF